MKRLALPTIDLLLKAAAKISRIPVWVEGKVGSLALRTLAVLGRRAAKRGDVHEAAHCNAAVLVGHSTHDDGWPCNVGEIYSILADNKERGK